MAVGAMGMSLGDFVAMSPLEFGAVQCAWEEEREARDRAAWERCRLLGTWVLMPHAKRGGIAPVDLIRFGWDQGEVSGESMGEVPRSTREDFERALARFK